MQILTYTKHKVYLRPLKFTFLLPNARVIQSLVMLDFMAVHPIVIESFH